MNAESQMAAESDGGGSNRDKFNWAVLSHSNDHYLNRRGRGAGQSGPRRHRRGNRGSHAPKEAWRDRGRNEVHGNPPNRYTYSASKFSATNSFHEGDGNVHLSEGSKSIEGKDYVRRGTWKKGRQSADSRIKVGGKLVEGTSGEKQSSEMGNLQKKYPHDHEVHWERSIDDLGYHHNRRNFDAGYHYERNQEQKTLPTGNRGFSNAYVKNQRNGSYLKRRTEQSRKPIDSEQARALTEQLMEESYECMVCCEFLRSSQATWSCQNCYHIFHLRCIKQWAKSSVAALKEDVSGWRCPACQNVTMKMPSTYNCFCGKITNPAWNPRLGIIPHSCGEICKKQRTTPPCPHPCNVLCHPGPCPSCPVMVNKECPCGKTRAKMRCGQRSVLKCKGICEKLLNCGKHYCKDHCHEGSCKECEASEDQYCFCGKENRQQNCAEVRTGVTDDENGVARYSCQSVCSRALDCGNHFCSKPCHPGSCESCEYLPRNIEFCPCKQTRLSDLFAPGETRQSCLDPVLCCDNVCGKKLPCGSPGNEHYCKRKCHTGACSPCDGLTTVKCRCGFAEMEIPCKEYNSEQETLCDRRCSKKRKCGRHRCNKKCCVDIDHVCPLICGRKLTCGLHKCDEPCHQGNCPRCWQTSFEERSCYCGETVQHPPIPCGTPLLQCKMQCTRIHPCGHDPQHNCHNDENCPPCVILMEKQCLCGKDMRQNIPCYLNNVSCGMPCGKVLPCKLHSCLKICHKGQCLEIGEHCQQLCTILRRDCPHPCRAPCHVGEECPEGPCKSQICIKCKCGRKSEKVLCLAGNAKMQYHRLASEAMGDKLRNLRSGQSIDISGLILAEKRKGLDCDEECALFERNMRLAGALGIESPEISTFKSLQFSDSLKEEAKTQLPFVKTIEETIEDLINRLRKSSVTQISHSFPPMNSSQRKLIHELAEHYNCKTVSYDPEPKRNTVVTATKDSVIVNTKLSAIIERKVLKPLPNPVLSFKESSLNFQEIQRKAVGSKPKNPNSVDYFDDDFE